MLRRTHIAHFALEHSPEKEQRLLFADPIDPNAADQNKIGNAESQNILEGVEQTAPLVSPVESIRMRTEEQMIAVDPKQLIESLKQNGISTLEILRGANALEPEREALGIEKSADQDQASATVESLFRDNLPDERIWSTVGAIRKKVDEYEDATRNVELSIKHMFRLNVDPSAIEPALAAISTYETKNDGEGILENITKNFIDEDNICRILKIEGDFTLEQRKVFLGILENMSRGNQVRRSFGQKVTPENDAARSKARNQFLQELNGTADTIAEYLDARINARATAMLDQSKDLFRQFNVDEPQDLWNITKDGIEDAFNDVFMELKHINRYHGPDGRAPIVASKGLSEAHAAIERLDVVSKLLEKNANDPQELPNMLVEKRIRELETLDWAKQMAESLRTVKIPPSERYPKAAAAIKEFIKFFAPFKAGNAPTDDERIAMRQTEFSRQQNILQSIRTIEQNPKAFELMKLEELDLITPDTEIDAVIKDTRNLLGEIFPTIFEKIDHPTAHVLKLDEGIRTVERRIQNSLDSGNGRMVARASLEAKRLKECKETLDDLLSGRKTKVLPEKQFYEHVPAHGDTVTVGYYSYDEGLIYINQNALTPTLTAKKVAEHELGHAIPDAFRRTGVFINLMDTVYEGLKHEEAADGTPFDQLLLRVADSWGISIVHRNEISDDERWQLMDELVNQYALWDKNRRPTVTPNERRLFNVFNKREEVPEVAPTRKLEGKGVRLLADDIAGHGDDGAEAAAPQTDDERNYEETAIRELEVELLHTNTFLTAYPECVPEFTEYGYETIKKGVADAAKDFQEGTYVNHLPGFHEFLKEAKEKMAEIKEYRKKKDIEQIDLTYANKTGNRSLWQQMVTDTTWVSAYDIAAMFKDAGTDIARMWKRRGETARKKLGRDITEQISDSIPYLGRLKHEFERSERESELEEVGVWEKGLDKIDTHVLQHEMLPRVVSKDQLKAILNVLSKKGRLEWDDDHGLWPKLEYFSGYKMPRDACKRDARLRNQWLQKMIADIWRDKDQFEHWKAENDGAIDSGRKHLDSYVEELSAASTLDTELRKLLYNFKRQKAGEPISREEEVNPHLYEGIIFYAMRNGKMSMEEKFFYLVKGVEIGLISVDRLRAFSGENFGILNTFPFIDFFSTGQNCSMHEIKKISAQITESGPGSDPFAPGNGMTKFLLDVVAFDNSVKIRVNKGLKGAEKIDHEDIPMLLTQVDFAGVNNIINFTSGSQAKVSAAAMMNGYVGYNSFMKYFGMKATIGHPPISKRDIDKISETLGAYAAWDNTITRHAIGHSTVGDQRPRLSWEQINNQAPVSGSKVTKTYRNAMNAFTLKLCTSLGISQINGIDIDDFIGVNRYSGADKIIVKKYKDKGLITKPEEVYAMINNGTQEFVDTLNKKLIERPDILKSVLQQSQESFVPESSDFNLKNVKQIWDKEPVQAEPEHGGGHH